MIDYEEGLSWFIGIPRDIRISTYSKYLILNDLVHLFLAAIASGNLRNSIMLDMNVYFMSPYTCIHNMRFLVSILHCGFKVSDAALVSPRLASELFRKGERHGATQDVLNIRQTHELTINKNLGKSASRLLVWLALTMKENADQIIVVRELLQRKLVKDINEMRGYGYYGYRCALLHSAAEGNYDMCASLLQHGASPDVRDVFNRTPLHLASFSSYPSILRAHMIVQLLLEHHASVIAIDDYGCTPFQVARHAGRARTAHLLQMEMLKRDWNMNEEAEEEEMVNTSQEGGIAKGVQTNASPCARTEQARAVEWIRSRRLLLLDGDGAASARSDNEM